jgi:hypothetical protein
MRNEVYIELPCGEKVILRECWTTTETDSYPEIEVRSDNDTCLCTLKGSLPDFEDEDFDLEKFASDIEKRIDEEVLS